MITELEIEGFKSFGSPAQKLSLGGLSCLIGANSSGKSNILYALEFVHDAVVQDIQFAVNRFGGISEVRNKIQIQRKETKPLRIKLNFETNVEIQISKRETYRIKKFDYEIELDLRSNSLPRIDKERLVSVLEKNDKKFQFTLDRGPKKIRIDDPLRQNDRKEEIIIPEQETTRLAITAGFFALPCVIIRDLISRWKFFNIIPNIAREPYSEGIGDELGRSGENLSVILHKLKDMKTEGEWDSLREGLKGVIPGFKDIKPQQLPFEGKWAFQIVEDKIRGAINPSSISDGTIRLLTILVITLWSSRSSSLITLEEPENGIHPHLSEHIVDILKDASERTQVIFTTHHPDFLDFLEPKQVILCDKKDGFTKTKHANDIVEIENFKKHFTLGELWEQGALGGVP